MAKSEKTKLFIEALPLTTKRVSGIGHTLASLIYAMAQDRQFTDRYDLILFGPKSGRDHIKAWNFPGVSYRSQPVRQRIITLLNFLHLLPPIDLWLGKGLYLFGNYTNFPLTRGSRSVTYIYDMSYLRYPEFTQPRVRQVLSRNVPHWIRRTDLVVTLTEYAKSEIVHFYNTDPRKIVVVPHGIVKEEFYPRPASEVAEVKKKYGLPEHYILFLSSIEPRKNIERLVRAYRKLPQELLDEYGLLLVGGDGWLDTEIQNSIQEARQAGASIVRPSHYVEDDDLPALHTGAAVLAHPAIYEGFGISPLQALACGTPVLAAKASSLPEVLGDAALYVDPFNEADIIQKLERLLTDEALRRSLRAKGLERAKDFTWEKSLGILKEAMDKLRARDSI